MENKLVIQNIERETILVKKFTSKCKLENFVNLLNQEVYDWTYHKEYEQCKPNRAFKELGFDNGIKEVMTHYVVLVEKEKR